ncbi:MAG TPA: MotA/TolQ/ExbB proton channel family protein [Povalibacter sp.]|uniref:MotA/TolQ/ExbB proton channel family protein n=1 Tax=Povalibacter sp. TaxID=1962978 RepID=UPI002BC7FDB1|nr:MotA/TolQ/ExbB proton channel family protein [Povalibacter sp.]HMN43687.1 MotA/TolQ/ExbB proton channel family protein [Povalibacter sp.]
MFKVKSTLARSFAAGALAVLLAQTALVPATQAAPASLEELLEQTRSARTREAKANEEREAKFLAERNKQAALMTEARAALNEQQRRSQSLSAAFDANEKKLTELQAQLDSRAGNLGEMFGVVRQVANDFSSVVHNSIITAQFPDRGEFVTKLAASKSLPSMQDLERFWFELQREMTETGSVLKYKAQVVTPQGEATETVVTRVGPFNATTDGQYLNYLPSQKQFAIMARQPGAKFETPAGHLEAATAGVVESFVDPTRGVLLSIYAQRPNVVERLEKGELVGFIIMIVGAVGAALAIYQLFYLSTVRGRVRNQLKFANDPVPDNPLGRVLATFKGDKEKLEQDAEIVELRISEAVMKEVPKLERFQAFLRLAVAAGPLLGLIGTVVGMIVTFQSITESGSSDPKLMAAGISQAMIATVLGLGIAIPLLFANAWLSSISKSIVQVLDEQSAGLLAERLEAKSHA